jgi:ADP-heptose:LPS heptosyltransferase
MLLIKKLEMLGRRFLLWLCGHLLSVHTGKTMERLDHIAVVRLDPRVGNIILLTPLLSSLKLRFPHAKVDVVAHHHSAALLQDHTDIDAVIAFNKKKFFGPGGVFSVWAKLRKSRYDLIIDASNPTFPSTTQALLVRFSKARYTTGVGLKGVGKIFTHPVIIEEDETSHEIDLRLQLLSKIPGEVSTRSVSMGSAVLAHQESAASDMPKGYALLNLGARLKNKQLDAKTYATIAKRMVEKGYPVVLTYGPGELELAQQTQAFCPDTHLAPPTSLQQLAVLMSKAAYTISCDTGPMHIAAATGKPVLGIFVSTPPKRYGYTNDKNSVVDARNAFKEAELQELTSFIDALGSSPST